MDAPAGRAPRPEPIRLLVFSASLRADSFNTFVTASPWSLRVPLEHLGSRVFPDMFSLAQAHQAFGEDGTLRNRKLGARFEQNLVAFLDLVEAAKHYPCMKKAWIEFLGEPGDGPGRVDAA